MSNSVRPHGRQPTRLPHPWDSPGKNTGVGCRFLLQCVKVKSGSEVTQSCPTLRPHGLQPTRLLRPWDFPAKRTGVGCHCLLRISHEDRIRFLFTSINLQWNRSRNNDYNVFGSCKADRCMWNNRTESDILLASSGGKRNSVYIKIKEESKEGKRNKERKRKREKKETKMCITSF